MNDNFVKHDTKSLPARAEDFTFSSHRNSFSRIPVGFSIRLNDWCTKLIFFRIDCWIFCETWHEIASCQGWDFQFTMLTGILSPDSGGIFYQIVWLITLNCDKWMTILWTMTRNRFLPGLWISDFLLTGVHFPGFRWVFLSVWMIDYSKLW